MEEMRDKKNPTKHRENKMTELSPTLSVITLM